MLAAAAAGALAAPGRPQAQALLSTARCPAVLPASPCYLGEAILKPTAALSAPPAFFMHDSGAFIFDDVVQCYLDAVGDSKGASGRANDLDSHVSPNISEHEIEYWLLWKLRTHPARTTSEANATLHFVSTPLVTSYQASLLPGAPCGTKYDHANRTAALAANLAALPSYKANSGRNFVLTADTFALSEVRDPPPSRRARTSYRRP